MPSKKNEDDVLFNDKSVISLAHKSVCRVMMRRDGDSYVEDLRGTRQVAEEALEELRGDESLSPLDKTDNKEQVHDQFRAQAAHRIFSVVGRSFIKEGKKSIETEGARTEWSNSRISEMAIKKLNAVINLVFSGWEMKSDQASYRKKFLSEKKAKFARRVLQETFMCASWDDLQQSIKQASQIKIRRIHNEFEVAVPSDIMDIIIENEGERMRHTRERR